MNVHGFQTAFHIKQEILSGFMNFPERIHSAIKFIHLQLEKMVQIYFGASGGTVFWKAARIYALNKENGKIKWKSEALDHIALGSQIVVGDDGTLYVIGYYNLYAIDPGFRSI